MQRATLALLLVACCGLGYVGFEVEAIGSKLIPVRMEVAVGTFSRTWTSGGVPITVEAVQQTGETAAQFVARCRELYDAFLEEFPKDA